jgi:hypothetical protein
MATARKTAAKAPAAKKAAKTPRAAKAAKPQAAKPAKAEKPAKADKAAGAAADKPRKPKLVRDSFTIPKTEYGVLQELKDRAARLGKPVKKSELLRAGVQALAKMADPDFVSSVTAVPAIKTGRPAKV